MEVKVTMQYSKSTKNTHVYSDESPDSPVPSIYIKRIAFEGKQPAEIEVSIIAIV